MSTSTRILLRKRVFPTAVGMLVVFCWFLFLTFVDSPIDPRTQWVLPFAGFLVAYIASYVRNVNRSMFPITDQQLAWIPMVAWPAATVAACAGYFLGQLLDYQVLITDPALIFEFWSKALRIWPWAIFIYLVCWRCLRIMPGGIGFIAFIPVFSMIGNKSDYSTTVDALGAMWPLWTAISVFLIWEAPYYVGTLRKLDQVEAGAGFVQFATPQLKGPLRSSWQTALADCIVIFAILGGFVWYLSGDAISNWLHSAITQPNMAHLPFLFFLMFPIMTLLQLYRGNRASGMSPSRATAVLLLECTVIGFVFREYLGVQRGALVRCTFCRNWQMAWHQQCLHCGDTQTVKAPPPAARGSHFFPLYDPGALMFRVFIPLQLLAMILLQHIGNIISSVER